MEGAGEIPPLLAFARTITRAKATGATLLLLRQDGAAVDALNVALAGVGVG